MRIRDWCKGENLGILFQESRFKCQQFENQQQKTNEQNWRAGLSDQEIRGGGLMKSGSPPPRDGNDPNQVSTRSVHNRMNPMGISTISGLTLGLTEGLNRGGLKENSPSFDWLEHSRNGPLGWTVKRNVVIKRGISVLRGGAGGSRD